MWRSTLAIAAGRVGEAERLIAEFAAIGARTADRNAAALRRDPAVRARRDDGRRRAAAESTSLERERDRPADYAYRAGYAWYLAARGRADEAREHASRGSPPTTARASATT